MLMMTFSPMSALFARLDAVVGLDAILATNTSCELSGGCPFDSDRER
jgi:hypothetical protein